MAKKSIKNYTTSISPLKTISEIEQLLSQYNVRQMNKFFDDQGNVKGVYFAIPFGDQLVHYKLPVDAAKVQKVLENDGVRSSYRTLQHSRGVGWRLLKDWIEAQLSLVKVEVVTMHEVFLPYAVDPSTDETLYDKFVQGNMPHLLTN